MPIQEQLELDVLTFNTLLRDAVCITLAETPQGMEYLDTAWRFKQTKPDKASLREQFGN